MSKCFWHADYFKLKTAKAKTQEETLTFPVTVLRIQIEDLFQEQRVRRDVCKEYGQVWGGQLPEIRAHSASLSAGPTFIHLPINLLFHLHVNCLPLLKSSTPLLPTSSLVFS